MTLNKDYENIDGKSAVIPGLHDALKRAARAAWNQIQEQHADEHWYAFAFYTNGEGSYIIPTANSEEGLGHAVLRYQSRHGTDGSLSSTSLRWSACDWPYHTEGIEHFDALNDLLYMHRIEKGKGTPESVYELCRTVLREMDQSGDFGFGATREVITLNVLMGDQSNEERVVWATELNPPFTAERLEQELAQGYQAFVTLSAHDRTRST